MMITAGRRPTSTPGTQTGYVSNSSKSQISLLPETDLREGHPPLGWRKCAGGAEAPFEFRGGAIESSPKTLIRRSRPVTAKRLIR